MTPVSIRRARADDAAAIERVARASWSDTYRRIFERVIALAYPENEASRRAMEKAGMGPDGTVTAYGREMTRHAWTA